MDAVKDKEIEVEVKISKPALETEPLTVKVPINGTVPVETSDNSTMTIEPEVEKNVTAEEELPAEPLPQKEVVPKDLSLKPKKKLSPNPESDKFMDKLNEEKRKLDLKSKGVKKTDFKLKEVDPYATSKADDEDRLVVPPLKTETLKNELDSNITKVKITMHKYNPVNQSENYKPASEVKENPVVDAPAPTLEDPYKINITVSKKDEPKPVEEKIPSVTKPVEAKAPPAPQPDLPMEEPAPK